MSVALGLGGGPRRGAGPRAQGWEHAELGRVDQARTQSVGEDEEPVVTARLAVPAQLEVVVVAEEVDAGEAVRERLFENDLRELRRRGEGRELRVVALLQDEVGAGET